MQPLALGPVPRAVIASVVLAVAAPGIASASAASHHHTAAVVSHHRAAHRHAAHHRAAHRRRNASTSTIPLPVVAITSGPANGSVSTSAGATFSFTINRAHPVAYCALDGAAFSTCTSPISETGLANGAHHFAVYATNDGLTSQTVTVGWTVNVPVIGPSTPANVVATPGDGQVSLSWNASTSGSGIASYRVFRNGSQVGQPAGTAYTDSGLVDGSTYSYSVQAVDSQGVLSAPSAAVSATPQAAPVTTPPPAPTPRRCRRPRRTT